MNIMQLNVDKKVQIYVFQSLGLYKVHHSLVVRYFCFHMQSLQIRL